MYRQRAGSGGDGVSHTSVIGCAPRSQLSVIDDGSIPESSQLQLIKARTCGRKCPDCSPVPVFTGMKDNITNVSDMSMFSTDTWQESKCLCMCVHKYPRIVVKAIFTDHSQPQSGSHEQERKLAFEFLLTLIRKCAESNTGCWVKCNHKKGETLDHILQ